MTEQATAQATDQINDLAGALAKAQGEMGVALKDASNPFFDSSYADLSSVIGAMREPFSKNGLSVYQFPFWAEGELRLKTRIMHSSGQWIEDGGFPLLMDKKNMQGLGSATTYARRYGLMAAAGIAPEDDDGNESVKGKGKNGAKVETKWRGPLAKMKLKGAFGDWNTALLACETKDAINDLMDEYAAVTEQLESDKPDWFHGTDDIKGMDERIRDRMRAIQAPPSSTIHAPIEGDWREKMEAALKACTTVAAVNALVDHNETGMVDYGVFFPDKADSLRALFDNKRTELAQAPLGDGP